MKLGENKNVFALRWEGENEVSNDASEIRSEVRRQWYMELREEVWKLVTYREKILTKITTVSFKGQGKVKWMETLTCALPQTTCPTV